MQDLARVFGIELEDFTMLVPNLQNAANFVVQKYSKENDNRLKMVDCLIGLSLFLFVV